MAQIPFSEAPYARGLPCPLYSESHLLWQKKCKAFLDKHYHPFAVQWEEEDNVPDSYWQTFTSANMFVPAMAMPLPCDWLRRVGIHDVLGTPIEEFDTLHSVIYYDEIYRSGLTGPFSVVSGFSKLIS
jgi:acyl-CoA dehydrogenase